MMPVYDLGCDPFNDDEKSFRAAIRDISQLLNAFRFAGFPPPLRVAENHRLPGVKPA
jgi:hypothetical protein